jgi:IS5 family transposase
MLGREAKQKNFFDEYVFGTMIPEDHILVKIKKALDFSFIEEETKDLHSWDFGRPAFPAEVMFRLLFLELFYNLSDVEASRQCRYNVLFRLFVGLAVEDRVPDDTSLVVFRRRLGEERFERLFNRVVGKAKEEGLLRERYKIIDATAVVADVAIPNTVNLLRQGRRVILKEIAKKDGEAAERLEMEYLTSGEYAPWLATGSRSSGEPRGYDPSVAGRGFMPRPRRGGREADEIGRPLEGGTRSGSPSKLTREKIMNKPTAEELGEEVERSRRFMAEVKGRYREEVDEKVEALEGILTPGEGHELSRLLKMEKEKGLSAEAVVADGLYDSGDNRSQVHEEGMKAYIPFRGGAEGDGKV